MKIEKFTFLSIIALNSDKDRGILPGQLQCLIRNGSVRENTHNRKIEAHSPLNCIYSSIAWQKDPARKTNASQSWAHRCSNLCALTSASPGQWESHHSPTFTLFSPLRAIAFKQNQLEFRSSDTISDSAMQPPGSCCIGPGKIPPAFVPIWSVVPRLESY